MREIKSELRAQYKLKRKHISKKDLQDNQIQNNFLESDIYKNAESILCYCALDDEILTDKIISKSLCDGKTVAAAKCLDTNGNMEFYVINSVGDLSIGAYNIKEPDDNCSVFDNFCDAVMIVPALCFDKDGYRLGYGKGYYDRYLQKHTLISVGLCYNDNIVDSLPTDMFDKAVDYIVTQSEIIDCKNGGKNG